eukprot:scaffold1505_cov390-Prasinococcus_capsulatus_cf.AAC.8
MSQARRLRRFTSDAAGAVRVTKVFRRSTQPWKTTPARPVPATSPQVLVMDHRGCRENRHDKEIVEDDQPAHKNAKQSQRSDLGGGSSEECHTCRQ